MSANNGSSQMKMAHKSLLMRPWRCHQIFMVVSFLIIFNTWTVASVDMITTADEVTHHNVKSRAVEPTVPVDAHHQGARSSRSRAFSARRRQPIQADAITLSSAEAVQPRPISQTEGKSHSFTPRGQHSASFSKRQGLGTSFGVAPEAGEINPELRSGIVLDDGNKEQRGRSMLLSNMIEQLSAVLHNSLVKTRTSKAEGRDISDVPESRQAIMSKVFFYELHFFVVSVVETISYICRYVATKCIIVNLHMSELF